MKVSIITIAHNRAHLIGETIRSVLDQTHPDFEHIIIDDGSTDGTENVVKAFHDRRIKYYKYQKYPMRSFLRNEAIRKATGELVSILDSDDLWEKDKLETLTGIFTENPGVDFVFHDLVFVRNKEIIRDSFFPYQTGVVETAFRDLLDNKILPFPVWTIKRSAMESIGLLDESMIDGQQDLYLRAAGKLTLYFIRRQFTAMKKHSQNISNQQNMVHYADYLRSLEKLVMHNLITVKESLYLKSKVYRKVGFIYRREGNYKDAAANYLKSLKCLI